MLSTNVLRGVMGLGVLMLVFGGFIPPTTATPYKVLVVMSYEPDFPWVQQIQEGIDQTLAGQAEIRYFYMETKMNFAGGPQKAQEAYQIFQEYQPDGVIAADDDAQLMFVVPYLKDNVKTPVIFCGVNQEASAYGYPAANVSGILERYHIKESIQFARQLDPTIKTIGFIVKASPTADAVEQQVHRELDTYPATFCGFKKPTTLEEALTMTAELRQPCNLLFMDALQGLPDPHGTPLPEEKIIPLLTQAFGKPTISGNSFQLDYGVLCAVVKTGQEHGTVAAQMLLQAMQGTPLTDLPITQNKQGKIMLNVDTMNALGINPKPAILKDVELVKPSARR